MDDPSSPEGPGVTARSSILLNELSRGGVVVGWVWDAGTFEPGKKTQTLVVAMGKLSSLFYAGNCINLQYPSVSTVFRAGPKGRFTSKK